MTVLSPRVSSFCCLEGLMKEAMALEENHRPQKGCFSRSRASGVQNWRLGWLGPTEVLES